MSAVKIMGRMLDDLKVRCPDLATELFAQPGLVDSLELVQVRTSKVEAFCDRGAVTVGFEKPDDPGSYVIVALKQPKLVALPESKLAVLGGWDA